MCEFIITSDKNFFEKWDAVNFEDKTITVRHKVVNDYSNGTEQIICEDKLKNAASRRTLPLIPHIERLLLESRNIKSF